MCVEINVNIVRCVCTKIIHLDKREPALTKPADESVLCLDYLRSPVLVISN